MIGASTIASIMPAKPHDCCSLGSLACKLSIICRVPLCRVFCPCVSCCATQLGRKVADGSSFGVGTGEGPSQGDCASYKVKIYNHYADETVELEVPEDRCAAAAT